MDDNNKDQLFQHTNPQQPYVQPAPASPTTFSHAAAPKNRKPLVIGAVAGAVVLLILVISIIALSSQKTEAPAPKQQATEQNSALEPAQSIDIEQVNNSINQDISGVNDDSQLPATRLDDKTLGL